MKQAIKLYNGATIRKCDKCHYRTLIWIDKKAPANHKGCGGKLEILAKEEIKK